MRRSSRRTLVIAAAGLMVALPVGLVVAEQETGAQATAQPPHGLPCASRTDVVRILRETFGERPVGHGLANSGAVAELFSGPNGTWTIVATSPNGISCMVGAGESWQTSIARDDSI
jgi:hypothetical protein